MRVTVITPLCLLSAPALVGYDAPLAEVRPLDCAFKQASRFDQSATTQGKAEGPTAYIKIIATGSDQGPCDVRATLHVKESNENEKELAIGRNTNAGFQVVDWSPDRNSILIASEHWTDVFSAPLLTIYDSLRGTHSTIDVEALFAAHGWRECSAVVEASGFTFNGEIVVHVEPGSLQKRPKDCSADRSYWAFDPRKRELHQLRPDFKQARYGKVVAPAYRPCKEDPNVVDACFALHGRAFLSNGTPSLRIWRIGTDRILGVFDPENEIIPDSLEKKLSGFDVDVYGDFEVCPFTKRQPGEMQTVCVESADHLIVKHN